MAGEDMARASTPRAAAPSSPPSISPRTRKGNTVYLHILAWPEEVLTLPALPAKIVKSSLLSGGQVSVQADAMTALR